MKYIILVLGFLLLFVFCAVLGAAVVKFLWFVTGMGEWTTMGSLPWGPSFFISLVVVGSNCSSTSSK